MVTFVCQDCGAESTDPIDVERRFCRICERSESEARQRVRERVRLAQAQEARSERAA